jgi:hypothetical protein
VRAGVVTGMPASSVVSSGASRAWWTWMPSRDGTLRATVTSIAARAVGRMPHSAAAVLWLSAAPGPTASTAAIQRPSRVTVRWPTA